MKENRNHFLLLGMTIGVLVLVGVIAGFLYQRNSRGKSNLFAYAIDMGNENWTYVPMGLNYGMSAEEVIKAERLKKYIWEKDDEILRVEKEVNSCFGNIKELEFVKRYFFDSECGLTSVRYEVTVASDYEETIRQMLYDQAKAYMPENNCKTDLGGLVDFEGRSLIGPWNKVVVWEDTKYQEDTSEVLTHADSDVVLRVSRPEWDSDTDNDTDPAEVAEERDVMVSLTVGCYKDRLSQKQIEKKREEYPICDGVIINPLIDVMTMTMEQHRWQADTFVYGEVVSDAFSSESSQYEMAVIDDTEGVLQAGEMISTDYRPSMFDYELYPTDGMKLVAMVDCWGEKKEWCFSMDMLYYVTEDGYVISTFDEDEKVGSLGYRVSESALSGLTLEDFLRKFKK